MAQLLVAANSRPVQFAGLSLVCRKNGPKTCHFVPLYAGKYLLLRVPRAHVYLRVFDLS